jgi:hypothetical protein
MSVLLPSDSPDRRSFRERRRRLKEIARSAFDQVDLKDDPWKWSIDGTPYLRISDVLDWWDSWRNESDEGYGRGLYFDYLGVKHARIQKLGEEGADLEKELRQAGGLAVTRPANYGLQRTPGAALAGAAETAIRYLEEVSGLPCDGCGNRAGARRWDVECQPERVYVAGAMAGAE